MPRVLAADVLAIRSSALDPLPFVLTATLLVDHYQPRAGWSWELACEIERWWAAHLMEAAERPIQSKRISQTTVTFATGTLGDGLKSTMFGQQVLLLDPTGTLGTAGMKPASIHVD